MDPYAVLGLQRGASDVDVKSAFRKLAKTCHPDLHPNDKEAERRFKEINAAHDAIRNPQPEPATHFRFDDFPFATPFDDMFANLRGFTRQQQRNNDIHMECRLTLDEAFHGKEVEINVPTTPSRTIKVRVPPGVEDGMNLRVAQAGDQSHKTLRPGDLYLIMRIIPHSSLTRLGRNLSTVVPVSVFDVLLGHEIEVTGIDGKIMRIAIPAGFDTSRKLRLAGQGMQDAAGRGDLLIELCIIFNELNEEQRLLIQQAAKKASCDHRQQS